MARHYKTQRRTKENPGIKAGLILGFVLLAAGLFCVGIFVWTRFIIQPYVDPPAYQAGDGIAAAAEAATEASTEAPTEPSSAEKAQQYLQGMSTREKICQLFIVTPEALTGEYGVNAAGEQTKAALEAYPVGGIIYFSENLIDSAQTAEMIANSQSFSKTPLFISVDEEGGTVSRCAEKLGTTVFSDMFSYRDQGVDTARANAKTIASDIRRLGFNLDFAPVADVWSNPENTVIAERAYSDDYRQASELVAGAVAGFIDGGVIPVLKHFPGHGDTAEDSHDGLAYLSKTAEELRENELEPFRQGVNAGAGMVMVGHLVVPALDNMPATLSKRVVPTLLRQELGYDGVVITDSMSMGAITENYDYNEIVQGIFDADIDAVLCPDNLEAYVAAIEEKLADGGITAEQLDRKVRRILSLKIAQNLWN